MIASLEFIWKKFLSIWSEVALEFGFTFHPFQARTAAKWMASDSLEWLNASAKILSGCCFFLRLLEDLRNLIILAKESSIIWMNHEAEFILLEDPQVELHFLGFKNCLKGFFKQTSMAIYHGNAWMFWFTVVITQKNGRQFLEH